MQLSRQSDVHGLEPDAEFVDMRQAAKGLLPGHTIQKCTFVCTPTRILLLGQDIRYGMQLQDIRGLLLL